MSRKVWFQLMNREGNTVGTVDFVRMPSDEADVGDVRDAVQMKYSDSHLAGIATSDLIVYANGAAYDTKQALEEDSPIGPLGGAEKYALIIVDMHEEPEQKMLKTLSVKIQDELMNSIGRNLDIGTWQVGGFNLEIFRVEPDFPKWFYVREETIDIIKVFESQMRANKKILFQGTPGVGKSMLIVLFALYMALIEKKRVVLFRSYSDEEKGFSLLYLDAENKEFWRMDEAKMEDLDLFRQYFKGAVLCLDGFQQDEVKSHINVLGKYQLLATSCQYHLKGAAYSVLRKCLVPFWSLSDLKLIGAHHDLSKHMIKNIYFYSGGNMRAFVSGLKRAKQLVDDATGDVDPNIADLLNAQHGSTWDKQIDRIRMTGIRANDHRDLDKYMFSDHWVSEVTSEYALRKLGKIMKPTYYEEMWSKGSMLKDGVLMGIAFENYVHTLARDGKKIELQVREYNRVKESQHSYIALKIEAKSCCNDGVTAAECDTAMQRFATSNDDYWYPSSRCLKSIDSVAKLKRDGQPCTIMLIQITKSTRHSFDSSAINKYAGFFPGGCEYVALVPNKEVSDNFQLVPPNFAASVRLHVAYITTGAFDTAPVGRHYRK